MHPGFMISPSVRLSRPLGAGGMGSVWLADHLALKTEVVVKFMSEALGADPASRERFAREAIAASQVKSPHVVQTFDHGVAPDGTAFIVMERLEGEDLAHRIGKGWIQLPAIASIVTQVCRALARAHAVGIVHRDIKPDNIFLCDVGGDEPFVKLLDFGIAKATNNPAPDSRTRTGAMMGTPYYMSPEQFAGTKDIDFRTDLWSLGVVTFECVTGIRPFEAETIGGLAIAVHSGPVPVPSALRGGVTPALDAWFLRACARDPRARFQSAKEFADAFAQAIASAPNALADSARLPAPAPGNAMVTTGAASSLITGGGVPAKTADGARARRGRGLRVAAVAALILVGGVVAAGALLLGASRTHSAANDGAGPGPSQAALPAPSARVSGALDAAALAAPSILPAMPVATVAPVEAPSPPPAAHPAAAPRPTAPAPASHSPAPTPAPHPTSADPFQPHVF